MTDPSGPCENLPGRSEVPYRLTPRPNTNPPVSLSEERFVDFTPPFCIGFTVTLPSSDLEYLFNAMIDPFDASTSVASLQVSSDSIQFSLGTSEASFGPPNNAVSFAEDGDYVHLQLCVTETGADLYTNCGDAEMSAFFSEERLTGTIVTFLQNSSLDGGGSFSVR